jgi:hypothetical protein
MGKLEGGSFTGEFERWMRQVSLSVGPNGGPGEGGPSSGNVENSPNVGSGYETFLSMGAPLGEPGVELLC